jgi:uncharacterized membrane protein HdeD (DUF308 family)
MPMPDALRRDHPLSLSGDGDGAPWWVALVAGIVLFALGLVIFLVPRLTLALVIQFVGLFWLIDGVVGLACIYADRSAWGWKLVAGFLGVIGGLFVIQHPLWDTAFAPLVSSIVIGVVGILIGLSQLILMSCGSGWRTGIPGIISIAIGLLLAFIPMLGAVLLPLALAGLALVGGVGAIVASFRRRSAERRRRAYARDRTPIPASADDSPGHVEHTDPTGVGQRQ